MGKLTHGHARAGANSRTYKVWQMMRDRCENQRSSSYPRYGGRGISVCHRWAASFDAFLTDMGEAPKGLSIERIDNSGNYEPGNCRWATATEQGRNKRNSRMLELNGEQMPVAAWAERLGVSRQAIESRIDRYGMSAAEALTTPFAGIAATRRARGWARTITFRGESLTTCQWAERTGIKATTIGHRLNKGWTPEQILTTPVRSGVRR